MQQYFFFSQTFWSDNLGMDLAIWYDNVEHEPENGIFYEFEWEALDENEVDHKDQLSDQEQREIEKEIRNYLSTSRVDDDF